MVLNNMRTFEPPELKTQSQMIVRGVHYNIAASSGSIINVQTYERARGTEAGRWRTLSFKD